MNTTPFLVVHSDSAGKKPSARDDEAALTLDRLDQQRGDVVRADLGLDGS